MQLKTFCLLASSFALGFTPALAQTPTVVTQTVQATDVPRAIPDVGQITSAVTFPVSGTIVSMELFFQFTHQCERDLIMDLIAPDGHDVQVMNRGLLRCSGVLQTFTSDNTLIGGAGFFGGAQAAGVWKLVVKDDGVGFTGTLDSWRLTITVETTVAATRPVVVIPGIMGSELRSANQGDLLWIDSPLLFAFFPCDEFLLPLALTSDGKSPAPGFVYQCIPGPAVHVSGTAVRADKILDGSLGVGTDIYGQLLQSLHGFTVQSFPYDWRLDYVTIAQQLRDTITQLAPDPSNRVDIVAHSQGGLITRTYLQLYSSDTRVNRVIYLLSIA